MNCTPQSLIEASKCWDCVPPGMQGAVQTMLTCEWATATGAICDDPVVIDWLQRLANDFQPMPSVDTINAVCDFCEALRLYGIMDKMLVVNPIIPDSFLAMRYPLIWQPANGNSPWINHSFVAADLDVNGLQGDGASKCMDTGFIPDTHWWPSVDSGGLTVYQSGQSLGGIDDELDLNATSDTGPNTYFLSLATYNPLPGQHQAYCWDAASVLALIEAETTGFYSLNRTSAVLSRLYQARSTIVPPQIIDFTNADQTAAFLPTYPVFAFSENYEGILGFWSNKRLSFLAVHEGLTTPEVADFFDAVQTLRIQLNGGYV